MNIGQNIKTETMQSLHRPVKVEKVTPKPVEVEADTRETVKA